MAPGLATCSANRTRADRPNVAKAPAPAMNSRRPRLMEGLLKRRVYTPSTPSRAACPARDVAQGRPDRGLGTGGLGTEDWGLRTATSLSSVPRLLARASCASGPRGRHLQTPLRPS